MSKAKLHLCLEARNLKEEQKPVILQATDFLRDDLKSIFTLTSFDVLFTRNCLLGIDGYYLNLNQVSRLQNSC